MFHLVNTDDALFSLTVKQVPDQLEMSSTVLDSPSPTCLCVWCRLLEEESTKRAELEQIHLRQQRAISETEAEKQELEKERLAKESALQAAMKQLDQLEKEREGALEQYQVSVTAAPRVM